MVVIHKDGLSSGLPLNRGYVVSVLSFGVGTVARGQGSYGGLLVGLPGPSPPFAFCV